MGLIPDHADNRCRSVSALDAHVFESRRVPWAELALDDDPVAHRLHATSLNPSEHRHTLASGDHPGERSNRGAQARWPARPLPRARSRRSSRRRRRAGTRAPRRAGRRPRLRRRIGKGRARTKTLRCRTVDEWGAQSAKRVYWPKGMPQFAVMRLSPESCPATDPEPRLQGLVLLPIFDRRLDGADASSQREVRGRLLSPTAVDERESSWGGVGW
jgi:hypothetical protein